MDRDGNAAFYVDGVAAGTENASSLSASNIVNSGRNLLAGSWIGSHYLRGELDYAKIYKRALNSTEIKNITR